MGENTAFSKTGTYTRRWVKNERGSRFNINKICWYKRSTRCLRKEGAGQAALGLLFVGDFTFSKLVLA